MLTAICKPDPNSGYRRTWRASPWLAAMLLTLLVSPLIAGHQLFRGSAVGGISIDVAGVVGPASPEALKLWLAELRKQVAKPPEEANLPVEMRMVSLRGLEQACAEALQDGLGRIPDEVRYLAGLQRIQYIFVYPEEQDLVLAGPAEGWKVDDRANVVGTTTGRPVLQLDDLLVALRTVQVAREGGISCSINPTDEGIRNLNQVLDEARRNRNVAPAVLESRMKEAFGPQQVSLQGVAPTTHFARVLVAADYRMKRLAMNLDAAPIRGLPGYLEMLKKERGAKAANVNPRWWLTCNYEPVARSEDGLAWELRGPGVKAMTEDDLITPEGKTVATGKKNPLAERWAQTLTDKYEELSGKDLIFGELRNLMDMCVVAAIIEKEHLLDRAQLDLPMLLGSQSELRNEKWNAPKTVGPQVSFLQIPGALVVTASGGVQVESWQVANQTEVHAEVSQSRQRAGTQAGRSLWWN